MLTVRAANGLSVPQETPRGRIGQTPISVPDTVYYRRLIAAGALEVLATGSPYKPVPVPASIPQPQAVQPAKTSKTRGKK